MASVDENADGGVVTAVTTENADEISVDDERFEVAGGNLKLKDGMDLDFEADTSPIEVTITATAAGDNATHTVSVAINDANDAPEITVAAMTTDDAMAAGVDPDLMVSENSDGSIPGAVVAHIALSDQDSGDTHTLTVSDDRFETIEAYGQWWLKLKAGAELDYETEPTVMVTVTVTDDGDPAMSASAEVTVMVTDANDAPTIAVADGETPDGMPASSTVDENVAGAILGAITLSDEDEGQMHTLSTSDERFVTKQDAQGGWWLALADGVSLDHEAEDGSVMVTVTVTDDGDPAMSASTDVTITVNDVNEAPEAGTQPTVTAEADVDLAAEIDLAALFSDPDDGDEIVRWELSGNPTWLKLTVRFGEDDGNQTVTGLLTGKPKAGDDSSHMVTITATDGDGESGSASFYVVVDDGNDEITAINLYHLKDDGTDGDKNFSYTVDVDENHSGEVNLGRVTVDDLDSPHHPHGQHQVIVTGAQARNFEIKEDAEGGLWLVKKAGASFDHEAAAEVKVTIQAVDINGDKYPASHPVAAERGEFKGYEEEQIVIVLINDKDDDPVTNVERGKAGWWVTVDEDLEAEAVTAGQWLTFKLQTEGVNAAFKDEDDGQDDPTYTIEVLNGPEFLEIDKGGVIKNKKGMLPPDDEEGDVFNVRVTAEYDDKSPVHFDFQLTVAFSGEDNEDNDAPEIDDVSRRHYTEGEGAGVVVATFTVDDDENDLTGHPFAPGMPVITGVVNDRDADDEDNDASINPGNPAEGYGLVFEIKQVGTSNTYQIVTKEDPATKNVDETDTYLNHEKARELAITVQVSDAGETDTEIIKIDIRDENEAPDYDIDETVVSVPQFIADEEGLNANLQGKVRVFIKLFDVWEDEDENDDDNELTFDAVPKVPWITVLYGGAGKWEDIQVGPDGESGGNDDVTWATGEGTETPDIVLGDSPGAPAEGDDWVLVVEIDRSAANNRQSDVTIDLGPGRPPAGGGTFTLTATDEPGRKGTQDIYVSVTDDNLPADTAKAVTISGTPMEGRHLTANFDETKDPDLAGPASPALVVYTWSAQAVNDEDDGAPVERQVGVSNRYTPSQDDVDKKITVSVSYYELVPLDPVPEGQRGTLVLASEAQIGGSKSTSVVSDAQNPGVWNIRLRTNDENDGLTADVSMTDKDDIPEDNSAPEYTWEKSVNGRGGWGPADPDGDDPDDTSDFNLALADGKGEYYRLVVTYTDDGDFQERHVSNILKVGKLTDAGENAPALQSTGQNEVGGILQVNNVPMGASVQWQRQVGPAGPENENWVDVPGATGATLSITADHAGMVLRAMVTSTKDGNVTDIDVTDSATIDDLPNTAPTMVKNHTIDAPVDDMGDSTQVHGTVDLSTLFEDLNGDKLTYSVTGFTPSVSDLSTVDTDPRNTEWTGAGEDHVVSFKVNGATGTLSYVTDLKRAHDGDGTDAGGNMVSFTISASDNRGGTPATAMVHVRLNVKPSDIELTDPAAETTPLVGHGTFTEGAVAFVESDTPATGNEILAVINVLDENSPMHTYGQHKVTVSHDHLFEITNENPGDAKYKDDDMSTWQLRLKKGATFDHEAEGDADRNAEGYQIKLTITATDGGGKTIVKKDVITITINDDKLEPDAPPGTDVPGLDDDDGDSNDTENDTDDTDGDDDIDGGWTPPPPGMSIGLIEDFVDNMNGFDQDLLEDFTLIIDDGIDIA